MVSKLLKLDSTEGFGHRIAGVVTCSNGSNVDEAVANSLASFVELHINMHRACGQNSVVCEIDAGLIVFVDDGGANLRGEGGGTEGSSWLER